MKKLFSKSKKNKQEAVLNESLESTSLVEDSNHLGDEVVKEEDPRKKTLFSDAVEDNVNDPSNRKNLSNERKLLLDTAKNFEVNIVELKDKRIKFLTILMSVLVAISLVEGIALAMLSPLKTAVPYMLRVDRTTGYVDKIEPYNAEKSTVESAVVRYFIARYVENRESYDWFTIQTMFDFVEETSTSSVFSAYRSLYLSEEFSPLQKLGEKMKMDTEINSITFLQDNTAQVRFTKKVLMMNGDVAKQYPETSWIVTLSFNFNKQVKTEKQRLINPLGFQITSYSVDREVINATSK